MSRTRRWWPPRCGGTRRPLSSRGADGLRLIPAVIARAAELLRPGGVLALEHDDTQADAVPALLHAGGGWVGIEDHHDLAGRPRYARAVRR